MQKLNVILFRDGRPGHEKQSIGVIDALQKYITLNITEIPVRPKASFERLREIIIYFFSSGPSVHKYADADLIIGTGSNTHIPVLYCKKATGGRAVVCMKPMRLLRSKFDLCLVPKHDQLKKEKNVFETVGVPNRSLISTNHDPKKALIVIGGENSVTKRWEADKVIKNLKRLFMQSGNLQWTVTTSPRTPEQVERKIKEMAENIGGFEFRPFRDTKPGWIDIQYGLNKTVWVSGDSMSMVYEALSAGCNVGILPVEWKRKNNKFAYNIDLLHSEKRVVTLEQLEQGNEQWCNDPPLAEADKCAKEIIRRWWPKNLR